MKAPSLPEWNFDIDDYLNRFVPRSPLHLLPQSVSWFLGYRKTQQKKPGDFFVWFWALVGAFAGLLLIEGVIKSSPLLQSHGPVLIIGSFGAAAVLEYNTIESPLGQPRNSVLGHLFSAIVGVAVTKLFALSPNFEDLRWVAGALACGIASAVMGITRTIHPPAGSTALLAAIDPSVSELGWFLVPLVLLSSVLMLLSALVINNLQRQFPIYWWTPANLGKLRRPDIERMPSHRSSVKAERPSDGGGQTVAEVDEVMITGDHIQVPDWLYLADEEREILEVLRDRLRETTRQDGARMPPSTLSSGATNVGDSSPIEPPVEKPAVGNSHS